MGGGQWAQMTPDCSMGPGDGHNSGSVHGESCDLFGHWSVVSQPSHLNPMFLLFVLYGFRSVIKAAPNGKSISGTALVGLDIKTNKYR